MVALLWGPLACLVTLARTPDGAGGGPAWDRFRLWRLRPDGCFLSLSLVMGQMVTAIKGEPVGKKPSRQELAGFRRRLEQATGRKMSDQESPRS
jgi:hypothetical protein